MTKNYGGTAMKICFPVMNNQGMDSLVYNHFGSAPIFVVVDSETGSVTAVSNADQGHVHGACNPIMALNNQHVDAIVVGGIGAGALGKLNNMGIKVYKAKGETVRENVTQLGLGDLPELTIQGSCSGHSGGCCH
jgi:predicted Fe-Mo cluster-binding NifX family protein